MVNSVTRFGEIPPLWQICKNIWQFYDGLFVFVQNFLPTWVNFIYNLAIFMVVENGQMMKTIKAIWSHWLTW